MIQLHSVFSSVSASPPRLALVDRLQRLAHLVRPRGLDVFDSLHVADMSAPTFRE